MGKGVRSYMLFHTFPRSWLHCLLSTTFINGTLLTAVHDIAAFVGSSLYMDCSNI